jgi:uncharacterized cofD-like protein
VTAIVGVTDNGGHSGQLRRLLHLPQMGDTRQCLSALVDADSIWGQLLSYRFTAGELRGLSVGNLILAALACQHQSLHAAVTGICAAAGLQHRVLPVSDSDTQIGAVLADGQQIIGEWEIMQRQPRTAITQLFLQPPVAAQAAVLEAIAQADLLVLCPGSLLTGTVAVLLHQGIREAIAASTARCIYVCNLMTQPGQTDGYTATTHLATMRPYLGRPVDLVVLNTGVLPPDLLQLYAQQGAWPVANDLTGTEVQLSLADLVEHPDTETLRAYRRPQGEGMQVGLHLMRHDAQKLAAHIMALAATPGASHTHNRDPR